ncbi:MAG: carboxypeptidase regulatory-like domain-containing protein [Planctomycetota bacterium]|nr:carboxypeptidase regulatory-like domain-containing protein [Planctomycetota bacterium]
MTVSPLLRPLQVAAIALGLADIGLSFAWARQETLPPPTMALAAPAPPSNADPATATPAVTPPPAAIDTSIAAPARPTATEAILYGTAKRPDGSLVTEGVFWLYRGGEHVGTDSPRRGTFVFAGLQPGTHVLRSRIDDELPLEHTIEVVGPRTRHDVVLPERWLLTVNAVTPDGAPLADAVQKQLPGVHWMRGLTAAAFLDPIAGDLPASTHPQTDVGIGKFRDGFNQMREGAAMPKQTIGVLALPTAPSVSVCLLLRNAVVAQMPATPGQTEITFTLAVDAVLGKTSTVRMRIVDASGAPVAGARVALDEPSTSSGGKPADAEGRFVAKNLKPGRVRLRVSHKEQHGPPAEIDIPPGHDLDLGDVVLQPSVVVELALDNFDGKGSVRTIWLDSPPQAGWSATESYHSAQNGASQKVALFPGRNVMVASAPAGVAIVEVDTRALPAQPIRFALQRGGSMLFRNGVGAGHVSVRLRARSGAQVRSIEFTGTSEYSIELPLGEYEAELTDITGAVTRRPISLGRDGAVLTIP